jgi:hypothetical protein
MEALSDHSLYSIVRAIQKWQNGIGFVTLCGLKNKQAQPHSSHAAVSKEEIDHT